MISKDKIIPLIGVVVGLVAVFFINRSNQFHADAYVKSIMDNLFLDDSTEYVELVDITAMEAHTAYLEGLSQEADIFYGYVGFDKEYLSQEMSGRVIALYDKIYKYSRYEVGEANKTKEGYTVTVRIYPIDIWDRSEDDITAFVEGFYKKISNGEYDSMTESELEAVYQDSILTIIEGKVDSIDYLEPVDQTVLVKKDSDGIWEISEEDFQNLDTYVIAY